MNLDTGSYKDTRLAEVRASVTAELRAVNLNLAKLEAVRLRGIELVELARLNQFNLLKTEGAKMAVADFFNAFQAALKAIVEIDNWKQINNKMLNLQLKTAESEAMNLKTAEFDMNLAIAESEAMNLKIAEFEVVKAKIEKFEVVKAKIEKAEVLEAKIKEAYRENLNVVLTALKPENVILAKAEATKTLAILQEVVKMHTDLTKTATEMQFEIENFKVDELNVNPAFLN